MFCDCVVPAGTSRSKIVYCRYTLGLAAPFGAGLRQNVYWLTTTTRSALRGRLQCPLLVFSGHPRFLLASHRFFSANGYMADSIHMKNGAVLRRTRSIRTPRAPDSLAAPAFASLRYIPPSSAYRTRPRPLIPSTVSERCLHRHTRSHSPRVGGSSAPLTAYSSALIAWSSSLNVEMEIVLSVLVHRRIAESTGYLGRIQLFSAQFSGGSITGFTMGSEPTKVMVYDRNAKHLGKLEKGVVRTEVKI